MGRPPKRKPEPQQTKRLKLVDYSSTESEDQESSSESSSTNKRKCIHKMYTRGQKSKVAYYARHHGIRKAAKHYGIHHSNVQRWMKDQVTAIKNPRKRANKKGHGRKIMYAQELEETLLLWILENREQDFVAVSTQAIRLKALSLIKESNPNFKASDGWVRKFMRRNDLC